MSEPFVYIASYGIKPESSTAPPSDLRDIARVVKEQEPRLSSFPSTSTRTAGARLSFRYTPDGDSMATHMAIIANHIAHAWDWLDLDDSQQLVLGTPPDVLTEYWAEFKDALDTYPAFVAGFDRAAASTSVGRL